MAEINLGNNLEEKISFIGRMISDALNVILDRAIKTKSEGELRIEDNKLPDSGILQNCEFGMILNEGVIWLKSHNCLRGTLRDENIIKDVVIFLLEKTIKRAIDRKNEDEGGREEKDIVFFSGQPYTLYKKRGQDYYASNLDAAMIIISFIATSLTHFNEIIAEKEIKFESTEIPKWVKTLRDASIFVISEGLKYAQKCKVYKQNSFAGFTCDPTSNSYPQDGGILNEHDRLFFTWTAAETIYDMIRFKENYLKKIQGEYLEEEGAKALIKLIDSLDGTLLESSIWVEQTFYADFENIKKKLEGRSVKDIVDEIQPIGDRPLNAGQGKSISILRNYIPYVYHISQYAAIRSLSEKADIDKEEIEKIPVLLKELVIEDIINSGLDNATQKELYNTLTRFYDLGNSGPESYQDDAYYPLVVRSTSSLLIRTIKIIKKELNREDGLKLIDSYSKILDIHVKKLLDRKPNKQDDGDEYLWSYAPNGMKEYVLYATQRTIFALLRFGDFLEAIDDFKREEITTDSIKTQLRNKLAQSIAENLLGPEVMRTLVEFSSSVATEKSSATIQNVPLPNPDWAADTIKNWLEDFVKQFYDTGVEEILNDRVNKLIHYLKFVSSEEINIPDELQNAERIKIVQNNVINERKNIIEACPEIDAMNGNWDNNKLLKILFNSIFKEFVNHQEASLKKFLDNDMAKILSSIANGSKSISSFKNILEKGNMKKNK